jgi:Amt family ammonium transporter
MTVLGAALLWFGWFGFNAGSALAANGLAASAFMVTHVAAASAGFTWAMVEWAHRGKPTILGIVTGAVAGLVAITPASGYVTALSAFVIGIGAGIVGYWGVNILKPHMGYDDSLDVFGVHGLCGSWGAIATGLFATRTVNPTGADGAIHGNIGQLGIQLVGVLAAWALAAGLTWLILKGIARFVPLRVTEEEEVVGLDVTVHGEVAYHFLAPGMSRVVSSGTETTASAEGWAHEPSPEG